MVAIIGRASRSQSGFALGELQVSKLQASSTFLSLVFLRMEEGTSWILLDHFRFILGLWLLVSESVTKVYRE